MEVILLSDVEKLGLRGEVVDVKRGYARNFLLPRRLAEPATAGKIAALQRRDEQRARQEARTFEQGQEIADVLRQTELRFDVKAGPGGALFGSVTPTDIVDELWRVRKIRVDRRKIELAEPIRRIGRYEVPIEVFTDVSVDVKTLVVPEGGDLPPEEEELPTDVASESGGEPAPARPEGVVAPAEDASTATEDLEAEQVSAPVDLADADAPPADSDPPPPA